ncbi:hypothetical protein ACWYXO_06070 [Janthinobacterium aestuarii]
MKYADVLIGSQSDGNSGNLAQLLRIWTAAVTAKGQARRWVRIRSERDICTAQALYKRVAHASLAYWLDDKCKPCNGTGASLASLHDCTACTGTGKAEVECAGGFERERIKDMVSELAATVARHAERSRRRLR